MSGANEDTFRNISGLGKATIGQPVLPCRRIVRERMESDSAMLLTTGYRFTAIDGALSGPHGRSCLFVCICWLCFRCFNFVFIGVERAYSRIIAHEFDFSKNLLRQENTFYAISIRKR